MRVATRSSATGPAAVGLDKLVVDGGLFVGVGRFAPRTRGQPLAPGLAFEERVVLHHVLHPSTGQVAVGRQRAQHALITARVCAIPKT